MYSHNERSNGRLVKKGSKPPPTPKDVTGMLPALPSVELCKKNNTRSSADCREDRKAARKGNGRARQCRRNKDAWESKLSFAISIILYISQAPQAVKVTSLTESAF